MAVARADLLLKLVEAGSKGDSTLFRQTAEAIIAEERKKNHTVLADRLSESLLREPREGNIAAHMRPRTHGFVHTLNPTRRLSDLHLTESVSSATTELIEEQQRADLLRSYNLEPRHRILLTGPPGNGKTSLAEALAYELALPLLTVRYDGVIASYLGETAFRIGKLFELIRTQEAVLFFDEFDAIGKERGDPHDTGEVKRIVSSLLLEVDALPSYVIVVTATNHSELLDRAVWRRFQLRLRLDSPTKEQREEFLLEKFSSPDGSPSFSISSLAQDLAGLSFSELEEFALDVRRRSVLAGHANDPTPIVRSRVAQWKMRKLTLQQAVGRSGADG